MQPSKHIQRQMEQQQQQMLAQAEADADLSANGAAAAASPSARDVSIGTHASTASGADSALLAASLLARSTSDISTETHEFTVPHPHAHLFEQAAQPNAAFRCFLAASAAEAAAESTAVPAQPAPAFSPAAACRASSLSNTLLSLHSSHLLSFFQPSYLSSLAREQVFRYIQSLVFQLDNSLHLFSYGSVPLKTYLPEGDIDIGVVLHTKTNAQSFLLRLKNQIELEAMRLEKEKNEQMARMGWERQENMARLRGEISRIQSQLGSIERQRAQGAIPDHVAVESIAAGQTSLSNLLALLDDQENLEIYPPPPLCPFTLTHLMFINAPEVKILKLQYNASILIDISVNTTSALATVCWIEEVEREMSKAMQARVAEEEQIKERDRSRRRKQSEGDLGESKESKHDDAAAAAAATPVSPASLTTRLLSGRSHNFHKHLLKQSILLIKAWSTYESRTLASSHALLSTYALEILVIYVLQQFPTVCISPLHVLYVFLTFYAHDWDWEKHILTLAGPVDIEVILGANASPNGSPTAAQSMMQRAESMGEAAGGSSSARESGVPPLPTAAPLLPLEMLAKLCLKYARKSNSSNPSANSSTPAPPPPLFQHANPLALEFDATLDARFIDVSTSTSSSQGTSTVPPFFSADNISKSFVIKACNILDPLDPANNLGKSVNYASFLRIRACWRKGASTLQRVFFKAMEIGRAIATQEANEDAALASSHILQLMDSLKPQMPVAATAATAPATESQQSTPTAKQSAAFPPAAAPATAASPSPSSTIAASLSEFWRLLHADFFRGTHRRIQHRRDRPDLSGLHLDRQHMTMLQAQQQQQLQYEQERFDSVEARGEGVPIGGTQAASSATQGSATQPASTAAASSSSTAPSAGKPRRPSTLEAKAKKLTPLKSLSPAPIPTAITAAATAAASSSASPPAEDDDTDLEIASGNAASAAELDAGHGSESSVSSINSRTSSPVIHAVLNLGPNATSRLAKASSSFSTSAFRSSPTQRPMAHDPLGPSQMHTSMGLAGSSVSQPSSLPNSPPATPPRHRTSLPPSPTLPAVPYPTPIPLRTHQGSTFSPQMKYRSPFIGGTHSPTSMRPMQSHSILSPHHSFMLSPALHSITSSIGGSSLDNSSGNTLTALSHSRSLDMLPPASANAMSVLDSANQRLLETEMPLLTSFSAPPPVTPAAISEEPVELPVRAQTSDVAGVLSTPPRPARSAAGVGLIPADSTDSESERAHTHVRAFPGSSPAQGSIRPFILSQLQEASAASHSTPNSSVTHSPALLPMPRMLLPMAAAAPQSSAAAVAAASIVSPTDSQAATATPPISSTESLAVLPPTEATPGAAAVEPAPTPKKKKPNKKKKKTEAAAALAAAATAVVGGEPPAAPAEVAAAAPSLDKASAPFVPAPSRSLLSATAAPVTEEVLGSWAVSSSVSAPVDDGSRSYSQYFDGSEYSSVPPEENDPLYNDLTDLQHQYNLLRYLMSSFHGSNSHTHGARQGQQQQQYHQQHQQQQQQGYNSSNRDRDRDRERDDRRWQQQQQQQPQNQPSRSNGGDQPRRHERDQSWSKNNNSNNTGGNSGNINTANSFPSFQSNSAAAGGSSHGSEKESHGPRKKKDHSNPNNQPNANRNNNGQQQQPRQQPEPHYDSSGSGSFRILSNRQPRGPSQQQQQHQQQQQPQLPPSAVNSSTFSQTPPPPFSTNSPPLLSAPHSQMSSRSSSPPMLPMAQQQQQQQQHGGGGGKSNMQPMLGPLISISIPGAAGSKQQQVKKKVTASNQPASASANSTFPTVQSQTREGQPHPLMLPSQHPPSMPHGVAFPPAPLHHLNQASDADDDLTPLQSPNAGSAPMPHQYHPLMSAPFPFGPPPPANMMTPALYQHMHAQQQAMFHSQMMAQHQPQPHMMQYPQNPPTGPLPPHMMQQGATFPHPMMQHPPPVPGISGWQASLLQAPPAHRGSYSSAPSNGPLHPPHSSAMAPQPIVYPPPFTGMSASDGSLGPAEYRQQQLHQAMMQQQQQQQQQAQSGKPAQSGQQQQLHPSRLPPSGLPLPPTPAASAPPVVSYAQLIRGKFGVTPNASPAKATTASAAVASTSSAHSTPTREGQPPRALPKPKQPRDLFASKNQQPQPSQSQQQPLLPNDAPLLPSAAAAAAADDGGWETADYKKKRDKKAPESAEKKKPQQQAAPQRASSGGGRAQQLHPQQHQHQQPQSYSQHPHPSSQSSHTPFPSSAAPLLSGRPSHPHAGFDRSAGGGAPFVAPSHAPAASSSSAAPSFAAPSAASAVGLAPAAAPSSAAASAPAHGPHASAASTNWRTAAAESNAASSEATAHMEAPAQPTHAQAAASSSAPKPRSAKPATLLPSDAVPTPNDVAVGAGGGWRAGGPQLKHSLKQTK